MPIINSIVASVSESPDHITVTNLQDSTTRDSPVPAENLGAIPVKTSARSYHRARKSSSRTKATASRRLTSRSFSASADAAIVGRLAMVTQDNAAIYAGRDRNNRVLSAVTRGQYLDICGENNGQYAVLMIDRTIGYVSKDSVQMMEYQVVQGQSTNQNAVAGSDTQTAPTVGSIGQRLVQDAYGYMGVRYVWGGDTRGGIDLATVARELGVSYPTFRKRFRDVMGHLPANTGCAIVWSAPAQCSWTIRSSPSRRIWTTAIPLLFPPNSKALSASLPVYFRNG